MKPLITLLACALSITSYGQSVWTSLFQADPFQAGGYFIVDLEKASSLGVSHVVVDIIASELQGDGSTQDHVVETLEIDLSEGFYANLDFSEWTQLIDPFRVHYQARGLAPGGNVVVDVAELCDGCSPWPEKCRETCVSNLYAYTLVAYSNGAQAVIELHEATIAGDYTYVYVKASNWLAFKQQFSPSFFGIGANNWSELENWAFAGAMPWANELKRFQYPNQVPPPNARDYMGYLLGPVTENVYAVKRGKGPWQGLHQPTSVIASQALYGCGTDGNVLRPLYNGNQNVQNAMATYSTDPLACQGSSVNGAGLPWGSGYAGWCPYDYGVPQQNDPIFTDLPISVAEWVTEILDCVNVTWPAYTHARGLGPNGEFVFADVANVIFSHWNGTAVTEALSVPVNSVDDPRLWPVHKTEVQAGLYDISVVLNEGSIFTRFVEFGQPTILQADFASFTTVNIYPVPVTETTFAVDIDLGLPTSVTLSIIDNLGSPYHNKVLDFDLPGKHKHVVEMQTQWPNGIYHAIFQFPDGSSLSVSFIVTDQ